MGVPFRRLFEGGRRLIEGDRGGDRSRKQIFFPCFAACPGEEHDGAVSIFSFFFFDATVNETAPFFSKRVVSFKWILAPNTSDSKKALHLRVFCILVLGLGFLQLSP